MSEWFKEHSWRAISWTTYEDRDPPFSEACHLGFSSAVEPERVEVFSIRGLLPVTPEVASSSLVGPANPFKSATYIDQVFVRPPARKAGASSGARSTVVKRQEFPTSLTCSLGSVSKEYLCRHSGSLPPRLPPAMPIMSPWSCSAEM